MNAPLLKERELFLSKKQPKGNGLRSLQMTADQLLYVTHYLSLTKETVTVELPKILAMQCAYSGSKPSSLVSTVVQWLENIGLLDQRFRDQSIIDYALLMFLYNSGARASEAVNLRVRDIAAGGGVRSTLVTIRGCTGGGR